MKNGHASGQSSEYPSADESEMIHVGVAHLLSRLLQ